MVAGGLVQELLRQLEPEADHRGVERLLGATGWIPCGAGDWAVAFRSPDGAVVARVSPFDPGAKYSVALYRDAAHTRQVPELYAHRRLAGGGDLQLMEWLQPVPEAEAKAFQQAIVAGEPHVAELAAVVRRIEEWALREQGWFATKVDDNPDNIMRSVDGRLVAADLFGPNGPVLYAAVLDDPDRVVASLPAEERRFMTELPLTATGSWDPEVREAMRAQLAAADARVSGG